MQRECLHRVHSFEPLALTTLTLALTLCPRLDPRPNQASAALGPGARFWFMLLDRDSDGELGS